MEKRAQNSSTKGFSDPLDGQLGFSVLDGAPCLESTRPLVLPRTKTLPDETAGGLKEGRLVTRFPEQLRPHGALCEIGWTDINELNEAARRNLQLIPGPILITHDGIILSGLGSWRLALLQGRQHVSCVEYDINEEDSLQYILAFHRAQRRWNPFILICLALTLEPYFQQKALDNMRAGAKSKGSTNLTKAQLVDTRSEIAAAAGVSVGNVTKVKQLIKCAHPKIQQAVRTEEISIHRAWKLSRLPIQEQLCELEEFRSLKGTNQTSRRLIAKHVATLSQDRLIPSDVLRSQRYCSTLRSDWYVAVRK